LWTVVCKYDINGHLIDSINQRDHASFKYNSAGDCTEGYFHHGNGDCIYDETHYCKYDNYHRLIVDSIKSPFNSGKGVTRYSYNSAGKISGMTVHYYSEYPDYTVLYEYDSVSNRTRKSAYENGRLCSLETFAYDAHNQVIQNTYKSMSERGFWISKHQYQYTYNSQNKLVRKLEYRDNPTNNNPETLYNYDMKGSLLVETEFRNSDHDCFAITIYENGLKKELLSYAQNKLRARQIYSYEYW
jgi:antitoxin component YwqK of YwqJK toxin-antitoxin module